MNKEIVSIREMQMSDYENVIKLWSESENLSLRSVDSKEHIYAYLERNPALSFVVLHQDQIIGAVLAGTDGRRGYLQHLAITKEYRGQGIGQLLVEKCTQAFASIGIMKTHLFVLNENERAQSFYKKLGWQERIDVQMFSFTSSDAENI